MPPGSLFMHLLPPTKNHQPRLPWHEGTPWSWHTHAPGDLLRQGLHPTAPGSCDNAPRVRCCRRRVWTCWNGGSPLAVKILQHTVPMLRVRHVLRTMQDSPRI